MQLLEAKGTAGIGILATRLPETHGTPRKRQGEQGQSASRGAQAREVRGLCLFRPGSPRPLWYPAESYSRGWGGGQLASGEGER